MTIGIYLDLVMMVQPISFLDKACHQQESKTQCNPPDFHGNCGRLNALHVPSWHPLERGESRLHLHHRLLIPSGDDRQRQAWSKSVLITGAMWQEPLKLHLKKNLLPSFFSLTAKMTTTARALDSNCCGKRKFYPVLWWKLREWTCSQPQYLLSTSP